MIRKLTPWDEQSPEDTAILRTWASANQINPDHVLPTVFVDFDAGTVHCLEVVRPADSAAEARWPSVFGFAFHRFGLIAADDGDQLVVPRVVPLVVDPPEQILAPINQAHTEGHHG